jgi:hypothetical protein
MVAVPLLALLLAANGPATALPSRLLPIDQCTADRSFAAFRRGLKTAVAKRDRNRLLALMAPDVLVDFGGAKGREEFAKAWEFDPREPDNIWSQLERMLKLGCARSDSARIIPSLGVQFEGARDEDLVDSRLILPGAKLYREIGVESASPKTLPWTLAKATDTAGDFLTGVKLPDGREGFIPDGDLYEPLGYRMMVERRSGRWLITAFVAGD